MKKIFFGTMVVVTIAVVAMINVNLNKVSNKGNLAFASVEALAEEEVSYSCTVTTNCYDVWKPEVLTGTISCTGTDCLRSSTSVTCDDKTINC